MTAQGPADLLAEGLPPSPASPLALAVPNVSEGRDPATVAALAEACAVPGARVIDVHSDPDHDRSVLTVVGEPLALQEALVALAGECVDRIDLRRQHGVHPRVGALDVAPIVALADEDVPLAIEIATGLAGRLGEELNLPVFLYGRPPPTRCGRSRATSAAGGSRSWPGRSRAAEVAPDHGPPRLHPTAGAVLVGARRPLIAINVWLPEGTLTEARAIAARVREAGGGPPGVRALGLYLPEAGMAQVSMNIEDHRAAPPALVIGAVRSAAEALGVESGDAELVGLVPREALGGPSPSALRIAGMRPGQILELRAPGLRRGARPLGPRRGEAQEAQERRAAARPQPQAGGARGLGPGAQGRDAEAQAGRAGAALDARRAHARGHRRGDLLPVPGLRGRLEPGRRPGRHHHRLRPHDPPRHLPRPLPHKRQLRKWEEKRAGQSSR